MSRIQEGDIFTQRNYGECKVVSYINCEKIEVIFVNTGYKVITSASSLRKGLVKDYMVPSVCGKGYNSKGNSLINQGGLVAKSAYVKWKDMLTRCYSDKFKSYQDTKVSEDWLDFYNFFCWYEDNLPNNSYNDYQLDKDILGRGLNIYSAETCSLVPRKINNLLYSYKVEGKDLPIGVHRKEGCISRPYRVYCNDENGGRVELGHFSDKRKAFEVYKSFKENVIRLVAENKKDLLKDNVYEALKKIKLDYEKGFYIGD